MTNAAEKADALAHVAARYAVAITPAMATLIDPADANDPIAAQFLPDMRELNLAPGESGDPIGDHAHEPVKGVVRRYRDRCLLKLVHVCAVYCRFCFRREMVGPQGDGALAKDDLDRALAYIANEPEIWEVILTGGDPFMVSARRAGEITQRLAAIEHVKILRWHTRAPIVDPERISEAFVQALKTNLATTYVVIHANHPRELTPQARAAIGRLVDAGVPVLAQSVLLKGVNDDAATLEALMRKLVEARVKPYQIHHLDHAPGTGHFRVGLEDGRALMRTLQERASGLCQPTYVLDIPGGAGKARAQASDVEVGAGGWRARGRDGRWRAYVEGGA